MNPQTYPLWLVLDDIGDGLPGVGLVIGWTDPLRGEPTSHPVVVGWSETSNGYPAYSEAAFIERGLFLAFLDEASAYAERDRLQAHRQRLNQPTDQPADWLTEAFKQDPT